MPRFYSDNPARDFDRWDQEQERRLARLPVCENPKCKKRIQDEHYFCVHGEILCEACMILKFRMNTDDLLEV